MKQKLNDSLIYTMLVISAFIAIALFSVFNICCKKSYFSANTTYATGDENLPVPTPNAAAPVNYISWLNKRNNCNRKSSFAVYLKAYEDLTRFEGDWEKSLVEPWSKNHGVAAWLEANKEGLLLFQNAASGEEFFFCLKENSELREPRVKDLLLVWKKPPGWIGHLNASKGLIAEGWRAWSAGDEELLFKNIMLVLRAAHHLQSTRWPISRLIGDGAAYPAYNALRSGLSRLQDPGKLALNLIAALESNDPEPPPFMHACALLRIEFWDLCQRVFLPEDFNGKWQVHRGALRALSPMLKGDIEDIADKLEKIGMTKSLLESNSYYDDLERWNDLPYNRAVMEPFPLERLLETSDNPLHQLQGALSAQVRARVERTIAQRRATHLVVHILIYKARNGIYPENLDQLAANDLNTLRLDPFSGNDFIYRSRGNDFILYSVAYNLIDDRGRHDPEWASGDYVFWPMDGVAP